MANSDRPAYEPPSSLDLTLRAQVPRSRGGIGIHDFERSKARPALTPAAARRFAGTHVLYHSPSSLSYDDHVAGAWLARQVRKYGFGSAAEMAKACKAVATAPKVPKPSPVLRVEVVKFMGRNGGFANHDTEMWKVEVAGVNGKRQNIGNWQSGGCSSSPQWAREDAKRWAALLGCKVVEVDSTRKAGKRCSE